MLKLCLAHPVFYPTFGGGSLRFLRYQPGLQKRDIQSRVLTGTSRAKDAIHPDVEPNWDRYAVGEMLPIESINGVPVHRVRLPGETSMRRTSTYFRALIDLCQNPATRPDVIQLHSFERLESLYWLARLRRLGIPIIYAIQIASRSKHQLKISTVAHQKMRELFYSRFDGVVTSSEQIAGQLRRLGVGVPIVVIPNGVDLTRYRPRDPAARSAARERLGIRGKGPVLMSVGAISPRKGSDLLLEAWDRLLPRHPDLKLVLVGPPHDLAGKKSDVFGARIAELIGRSGKADQVHLPGVCDDMEQLYAAADLFVFPTSREGGTPNVVLEAMACGVPVVLTPFDGQSAAIGRPNVEFAQCARSAVSLARAILELLEDPERATELAQRGQRWVRDQLALDRSLDRFADFYERAARRALGAEEIDAMNSSYLTSLPARSPSRTI